MKKAVPFLLLLLLLMSRSAFSQSDNRHIRLHVAPLNLFDPLTGVLQVGIQKNFNQRIALSLDHGIKLDVFKYVRDGTDREDYKYTKSKAELKYFIGLTSKDSSSTVFPYLSVEGMFFPQKYRKENSRLLREEGTFRYDYSNIKRTVWVASLKYGREKRYKRTAFDFNIGIGVRRISIEHQTFGLVEEDEPGLMHSFLSPIDTKEGVFYRPHISLGFKVGYSIR